MTLFTKLGCLYKKETKKTPKIIKQVWTISTENSHKETGIITMTYKLIHKGANMSS